MKKIYARLVRYNGLTIVRDVKIGWEDFNREIIGPKSFPSRFAWDFSPSWFLKSINLDQTNKAWLIILSAG